MFFVNMVSERERMSARAQNKYYITGTEIESESESELNAEHRAQRGGERERLLQRMNMCVHESIHFYIICNIIVNRDKRILFYLDRDIHTRRLVNMNVRILVTCLLLLVLLLLWCICAGSSLSPASTMCRMYVLCVWVSVWYLDSSLTTAIDGKNGDNNNCCK